MNKSVLVVAPHPDDETLGCGGTLLRHLEDGDELYWLIATQITEGMGFSEGRVWSREEEIVQVARAYGFTKVYRAGFNSMSLDTYSKSDLISKFSLAVNECKPNIMYVPNRSDAHSDHEIVFDAIASCTKSFRYPFIQSVRVYETLSETDFGIRPDALPFSPNMFVNVSKHIDRKIEIMSIYKGEMADHPFPRSEKSLRALATLRGQVAGCAAAEAFSVLREIV